MIFRIILSILSAYKVVTIPSEPNFSTISDPYSGEENPSNLFDFPEIFKRLDIEKDQINAQFNENVMSSK